MKSAAAKGRRHLFLAAVCLVSTLLAVSSVEASRGVTTSLGPALSSPAMPDLAFEESHVEPQPRHRLFGDLDRLERPLGAVAIQKTASGVFALGIQSNVRQSGGLEQNRSGPTFQGLWTDPVTGIAYARNRWYDARTASWLSEDPIGAVDSSNLYAFVGWGPHMDTDPMGLDSTLVDWRGGVPVWLEDDEVKVTPDDQSNGEIVETSDDQDDPSGSPSDAGDIMERLDRQPKEATMNDVLKSGFVDPHLPCVDSFSARYNESWEQLTTGLNSEMSHQLGYIGEAMTNMPGLPINMPVIGEALTAPEGVPGWPYSHSVARFTINATNVTPTIARLRGSHTIFGMLTGAGPSGIGKLPAMRAAIGTSLLAGPATYATYEAAIRVGTVINVQISDCKRIAPEGEGM